jgi:hypothetical protein
MGEGMLDLLVGTKELNLEDYLGEEVKRRKGFTVKLGWDGLPDRLIVIPRNRIGFLELKKAGKTPSRIQRWWIERLTRMGCVAGWADTREGVNLFLVRMKA